jgi:hypothetical protein
LRDHEGRIEADAEPADQRARLGTSLIGSLFGVLAVLIIGFVVALPALRRFDLLQECLGAGSRNGAERLDHLGAGHADAVVLDRKPLVLGIEDHGDPRLDVISKQRRVGDRLVAQPLAGIRRIGDQFAQEYRFVGIDRMHHQVQKLGDISLERPALGLCFGLFGYGHRGIPGKESDRPRGGPSWPPIWRETRRLARSSARYRKGETGFPPS